MLASFYLDEDHLRAATAFYMDLIREYSPDVVIDSFDLIACLAARILRIPLATVLQGNFHPASRGFLWWEQERPAGLPNAASLMNKVAGAGEIVMPVNGTDGEKHIDVADFRTKVSRVLNHPDYRNSARRVALSMRKYGGVQKAAQRLEQFANESPAQFSVTGS